MSPMLRLLPALAAVMVLSGCPRALTVAEEPPAPAADAVDAAEAIFLFDRICLRTAPSFSGADRKMAELGLTLADNGSYRHGSGTASVKTQIRKGTGNTEILRCSAVFDDDDHETATEALLDVLGQWNLAVGRRYETAQIGSRIARIWDGRIEGRRARVTLLPATKTRAAGVYLDIEGVRADA